MAVKFSLKAAPTFKNAVELPIHGGESAVVVIEFKHRTRAELDEWIKEIQGKTDAEVLAGCVVGWDLDDKCEAESFALLTQNYAGAGHVISKAYTDEIVQTRRKN
ncbi:Phage tail assembly chaperone [compost metagenome]